MGRWLILLVVLGFWPAYGEGKDGQIRMRARENYEKIAIHTPDQVWHYESFSHTFNIWYEKPFQWALGLATGPYVMSYKEAPGQGDRPESLGRAIKLLNHGIELKSWFYQGFFYRLGVYYHQFNSEAEVGRDHGYGGLLGGGYEWDFDGIGLALEGDVRRLKLAEQGWTIEAGMVAIGVHFYRL